MADGLSSGIDLSRPSVARVHGRFGAFGGVARYDQSAG
jgi:hypothetical protein